MLVVIAKWVWDKITKLGQYRRYQSWDSLGECKRRRKEQWNRWVSNFLRKRDAERSGTGEFNIGEEITWWSMWRRSNVRLFHKPGAQWKPDLIAILRREVREGRLRLIREKDRVEQCEGNCLRIVVCDIKKILQTTPFAFLWAVGLICPR